MYNILICDDEKDIRAALRIYLTNELYNLIEAENGRQAVEIADSREIHLALMDIMMPEMDGLEAMEKIREKHNFPILLLTAEISTRLSNSGALIPRSASYLWM